MSKKQLLITDATFRDGQQSLIATRMRTRDMMPVLEKMDNVGFHSMEVWGGATFDSCLRFLKEDPWERLKEIRRVCKKTKLQMLFRGQNMLGYKIYPDDLVEAFLLKAIENGIDIVRVFDALNDIRNLETSVKAIKKAGCHAQLAVSYTTSPVHTLDYYLKYVTDLVGLGADSICIKDMSGLLTPSAASALVAGIKKLTDLPLQVHSHYTSGLAAMSYLKAVEAGADIIDTAMSPFAMGASLPAAEVMAEALSDKEPGLNPALLGEISDMLMPLRNEALRSGLMSTKVLGVDIAALSYQVPGGMLSNLISQLQAQNAENRLGEVLAEIPRVRADFGYPPLVTPSSQIVGTQAVMNVVLGERYKMVPRESKEFVRGMYGHTPVQINDDIFKKILGEETPITERPASLLMPQMAQFEEDVKDYREKDEDVLTYALFPQVALDYFKYRRTRRLGIDPDLADVDNKVYPI